jgi:hypothetical protein
MPNKKLHIGYARLNEKSLNNFLKGKSFMIKPIDQEDESNQVVKLQYKAKKNLTKLNKNLSMNKGVRVNPDELEDMEIHSGNGLFDSLKGVMNSKLTKGIVKAVAPEVGNVLGNQISSLTGSQLAGNMTKSLIQEGAREMTGNGIRSKRGSSVLPLGGSLTNPNQYVGISYNSPDFSNPSERMAYVRSHRRSNGVVM